MTKISDAYDALKTLVATTLSGYQQLADPFAIENNNELYLTKGYALAISSGDNSNRKVSCGDISTNRQIIVTLVNRYEALAHDINRSEIVQKALMEDAFSVIKAVEVDQDLDGSTTRAAWLNDNGLTFLDSDRNKYLFIELIFEFEYFDQC